MAPFGDDFALFNTQAEIFRGGVWDPATRPTKSTKESLDSSLSNPSIYTSSDMPIEAMEPTYASPARKITKETKLRQRKSTPDLRSSRDIDKEIEPMPSLPKNLIRKGLHKHKSSDSLRPAYNKDHMPFDINDHIGELRRLKTNADLNEKPDRNIEKKMESKPTIANTMKRWGSWYFKDLASSTDAVGIKVSGTSSTQSTTKDTPRRKSAPSDSHRKPSKKLPESKPASAPVPHSFPSELLSSIENINNDSNKPSSLDKSNSMVMESHKTPIKISSIENPNSFQKERNGHRVKGTRSLYNLIGGSSSSLLKEDKKNKNGTFDKQYEPTLNASEVHNQSSWNSVIEPQNLSWDNLDSNNDILSKSGSKFKGHLPSSATPHVNSYSEMNTEMIAVDLKANSLQSIPLPLIPSTRNIESRRAPSHVGSGNGKTLDPHPLRSRAKSFGPLGHLEHPQYISPTGISDQEETTLLTAPALDQVPIELAGGTDIPAFDLESNFSVPLLAPPPRMHERTIAKRGSSDSLRKGTHKSSRDFSGKVPYAFSLESNSADSVIALPEPLSTATPYTYEQNLSDFLTETTAKFESSQLFDSFMLDQRQSNGPTTTTLSNQFPRAPHKQQSKRELQMETEPTRSTGDPENFLSKTSGKQPNGFPPVLSYRKVKPKQSQGFKFF